MPLHHLFPVASCPPCRHTVCNAPSRPLPLTAETGQSGIQRIVSPFGGSAMRTAPLQADDRCSQTRLSPTIPAGRNPRPPARAEVKAGYASIPGFDLLGILGRGGMATVYKAR